MVNEVNIHLSGAAPMIKSLCNDIRASVTISSTSDDPRIVCVEAFVFHTATTVPFQESSGVSYGLDEAFVAAQDVLERLEQDGVFTVSCSRILGAPPSLFGFVHEVSLLYHKFKTGSLDVDECLLLKQELELWCQFNCPFSSTDDDASCHARNVPDRVMSQEYDGKEHMSDLSLVIDDKLLLGPNLYALSCKLLLSYLISSLGRKASMPLAAVVKVMHLVRQTDPSIDYFAEYYTWPFFCIGLCLVADDDRRTLYAQVMAFWNATRNGTMRRLAIMLSNKDPVQEV